jgi:hypothetical protein
MRLRRNRADAPPTVAPVRRDRCEGCRQPIERCRCVHPLSFAAHKQRREGPSLRGILTRKF